MLPVRSQIHVALDSSPRAQAHCAPVLSDHHRAPKTRVIEFQPLVWQTSAIVPQATGCPGGPLRNSQTRASPLLGVVRPFGPRPAVLCVSDPRGGYSPPRPSFASIAASRASAALLASASRSPRRRSPAASFNCAQGLGSGDRPSRSADPAPAGASLPTAATPPATHCELSPNLPALGTTHCQRQRPTRRLPCRWQAGEQSPSRALQT